MLCSLLCVREERADVFTNVMTLSSPRQGRAIADLRLDLRSRRLPPGHGLVPPAHPGLPGARPPPTPPWSPRLRPSLLESFLRSKSVGCHDLYSAVEGSRVCVCVWCDTQPHQTQKHDTTATCRCQKVPNERHAPAHSLLINTSPLTGCWVLRRFLCWTLVFSPPCWQRKREEEPGGGNCGAVTEHQEEEGGRHKQRKRDGRERRRRDRFLCPRPTKLEEQGQRVPYPPP